MQLVRRGAGAAEHQVFYACPDICDITCQNQGPRTIGQDDAIGLVDGDDLVAPGLTCADVFQRGRIGFQPHPARRGRIQRTDIADAKGSADDGVARVIRGVTLDGHQTSALLVETMDRSSGDGNASDEKGVTGPTEGHVSGGGGVHSAEITDEGDQTTGGVVDHRSAVSRSALKRTRETGTETVSSSYVQDVGIAIRDIGAESPEGKGLVERARTDAEGPADAMVQE